MLQRLYKYFIFCNALIHFFTMIKVISKCRMDSRLGQIVFGTNHIEALTQMFMPHDHVLYGDAMSGDSRFSPNDAKCNFNMFIQNFREHIYLFSDYLLLSKVTTIPLFNQFSAEFYNPHSPRNPTICFIQRLDKLPPPHRLWQI